MSEYTHKLLEETLKKIKEVYTSAVDDDPEMAEAVLWLMYKCDDILKGWAVREEE